MAIEKGKVIIAIETKYKGKGLSKTFINGAAAKIAEQLETEEEITGKLDELDFLFTNTISEADRRVTEAVNKVKKPATTTEPETVETPSPGDDAEMPAYMKNFLKEFNEFKGTVVSMQNEKTAKSISERFHADERLKGLSPKILKGYIPSKEEDLEAAIELAADELKEFIVDEDATPAPNTFQRAGGSSAEKPRIAGGKAAATAGGGKGKDKEASKEELDKAMGQINI